jgi:V-type H+-transporting ATPase subunit F
MPPSRTGRVDGRSDSTYLIAVIGDEDTVTGFLLAGVGQNDGNRDPNYFVVDPST